MCEDLSVELIHCASKSLQRKTFHGFCSTCQSLGFLFQVFAFEMSEHEVHLSAAWKVVADAKTQTVVGLCAEDLCDVAETVVSGLATTTFHTELSEGECQIIDHNEHLCQIHIFFFHPIAHGVARKVHIGGGFEEHEHLVFYTNGAYCAISAVFPGGSCVGS